jgi:hypothetical protein
MPYESTARAALLITTVIEIWIVILRMESDGSDFVWVEMMLFLGNDWEIWIGFCSTCSEKQPLCHFDEDAWTDR